ncbi:uncharacterized protein LOC119680280 [Teleopsis dalmanni]|uniref:uncharacterized protein LOC119680280 n=1 Tax=Teleopsis dalmanni TaxID=139649 RepID=UPI0018CFC5BB|nr:uncharacterized protein LOC119680280 [Teleopsis dalmanni]
MTAHSMEPRCQIVPLMGLVRNSSRMSLPIATAESEPSPPPPPPPEAVSRVRRVLFDKPEPGDISSMLQKEYNKQILNFQRKYSFDVPNPNPNLLEENENQSSQASQQRATARFPTLIEREMQEHERRLQSEKCNLNRTAGDESEQISQLLEHKCSDSIRHNKNPSYAHHRTVNGAGIKKIPAAADVNGQANNERAKPYTRQKSITEYFNTRKTANNCKLSHLPIEVLELAEPLQTVVSSCQQPLTGISSTTKTDEATTTTTTIINTTTATSTASSPPPPPLLLSVSISTSPLPSTDI